jgi:hypothetical protein
LQEESTRTSRERSTQPTRKYQRKEEKRTRRKTNYYKRNTSQVQRVPIKREIIKSESKQASRRSIEALLSSVVEPEPDFPTPNIDRRYRSPEPPTRIFTVDKKAKRFTGPESEEIGRKEIETSSQDRRKSTRETPSAQTCEKSEKNNNEDEVSGEQYKPEQSYLQKEKADSRVTYNHGGPSNDHPEHQVLRFQIQR